MKKLIYIFLLITLGLSKGFAQTNAKIDSLLTLLKTAKEDTNKVNHLNKLCDEYRKIGDYDKGLAYGNTGLNLGKKLNFQKGITGSYNNIGGVYWMQGNYDKALEFFFASLKIRETIGDKQGIAGSYNNIGNIYLNQGNYDKALENYFASLKIRVAIGDKQGMAYSYNNIGLIYENLGNYDKALENHFASLKISETILDKQGISVSFGNIGVIYYNQGNYDKALENYFASLKTFETLGDKRGIADSYNNIGNIYDDQGNYDKALKNHFASLKIRVALGDKVGIATSYNNVGAIYANQGNYDKALENYFAAVKIRETIGDKAGIATSYNNIGAIYLKQGKIAEAKKQSLASLRIAIEIGVKDDIKEAYQTLSLIDSAAGNFKGAYEYHKLFKEINDSIFNVESAEKTVEMTAMYDSEKKETQIKLLEKDKEKQTALAVVEKKKQQTILYSVIGGLFLVLVFAGFMYNRFKITQKQKLIIEQKEKETHKQKEIIEEKHKEITDSINYAERIQRSFLATSEMLDKYLNHGDNSSPSADGRLGEASYFVFFRPKDVVSGDFYWAGELNNGNFAFSVADSTGHGVPGAIMSILNISSLEKSIEKETEPNQILNQTRKIIIERLKKDGSSEGGKDGMDCSLLVFNQDRTQLSFAAANNPVFILRPTIIAREERTKQSVKNEQIASLPTVVHNDGYELIEFRGDKMPVGKHDNDKESFTLHTALLQKGDVIYALTDGFPDQFGGDKGKKYMIKNLKELLLQIAHLPMLEQEQKLAEEFDKWKGENEQVDDVCIIGVRV